MIALGAGSLTYHQYIKTHRLPVASHLRRCRKLTVQQQWELLRFLIMLYRRRNQINWEFLFRAHETTQIRRRLLQLPQGIPRRRNRRRKKQQRQQARQRNPNNSSETDDNDGNNNDFVEIPIYDYGQGRCPDSGSTGLPCADPELPLLCQRGQSSVASFRDCLLACAPSFCCIHDTPAEANPFSPTCNMDENCPQYTPCYIAWWKVVDQVGPATEFQLNQADDFFDIETTLQDVTQDEIFFQQLLFHHFDDIRPILVLLGQADSIQQVFAMPQIWNSTPVTSYK